MSFTLHLQIALLVLSAISVFITLSHNLLCDSTITWNIPCSFAPCNVIPFTFNHTSCTLRTTETPNGEIILSAMMDVSSIFSNTDNYPINFTINAIPFGGDISFGIVFKANGNRYGLSQWPQMDPMFIMYEWESATSTFYNQYKNGQFTKSYTAPTVSSITDIGFKVSTEYITSTIGVMFDFAQLSTSAYSLTTTDVSTTESAYSTTGKAGSTTETAHLTTESARLTTGTPHLTTEKAGSSTETADLTTEMPSTLIPTQYVSESTIISTESILSTTESIQSTLTPNENDAEVRAITTDTTSTTERFIDEYNNGDLHLIITVLCVFCGCLLITVIVLLCSKYIKVAKFKESIQMMQQHTDDQNNDILPQTVPKVSETKTSAPSIENDPETVSEYSGNHSKDTSGKGEGVDTNGSDEVEVWLRTKVKYAQYVDNFISNGYDTMAIIVEITDVSFLQDIGIESMQHQVHIMAEIEMLQQDVQRNVCEGTTNGGDVLISYDEQNRKLTLS